MLKNRMKPKQLLTPLLLLLALTAYTQQNPYMSLESGGNINQLHLGGNSVILYEADWNTCCEKRDISKYLIVSETQQGNADSLEGAGIPLGFDFPYAGELFNKLAISAKGYVVLGKSNESTMTIYADTLTNDSTLSKRNPYLISTLLFEKEMDHMNSVGIRISSGGFPSDRFLALSYIYSWEGIPDHTGYAPQILTVATLTLHESGKVLNNITNNFFTWSPPVDIKGGIIHRYGDGKEYSYSALEADGDSWQEPRVYIDSNHIRLGNIKTEYAPQLSVNGVFTFRPIVIPDQCPLPFIWYNQNYEGNHLAYHPNEYKFLIEDTISTGAVVHWLSFDPNISYRIKLGTDTIALHTIANEVQPKSILPYSSHDSLPMVSVVLDSLVPSQDYILRIQSYRQNQRIAVCDYPFYTKSEELRDDYCGNTRTSSQYYAFRPFILNDLYFMGGVGENYAPVFDFRFRGIVPDTGSWTTDLQQGETYVAQLYGTDFGTGSSTMASKAIIFIDYNQNGVFEPEEGVVTRYETRTKYYDLTIVVPENAKLGKTRLRVAFRQHTLSDDIPPCGHGVRSLDFIINITPKASCQSFNYTQEVQHSTCFGEKGSIRITPIGGTAPYRYRWNTGNIADTLSVIEAEAGGYRVTINDAAGCELRTTMTSIINQHYPVFIDTTRILSENKVYIHGGVPPYRIEVSGEDLQYSLENVGQEITLPEVFFVEAGVYTLHIHDANDCEYRYEDIMINPVGLDIEYVAAKEDVGIYPNPATNLLYLYGIEQNTVIHFYSLQGQLKHTAILKNETNEVEVGSLPRGMYLVQINTTTKEKWQKMLLE